MAIVSVFCTEHSDADEIVDLCTAELGTLRIEASVLQRAAESAGVTPDKIARAMNGPPFTFNKFTHKRERYLAHLRLALAEALTAESALIYGLVAGLVPGSIAHCLRVGVLADADHRVASLRKERGLSEAEARRKVGAADRHLAEWTQFISGKPPSDPTLYDIRIPTPAHSPAEAVALIAEHARSDVLRATDASRRAAQDFALAARVELALTERGHLHAVRASEGMVTITIDSYVVRLDHLQRQLEELAAGVPGVEVVHTETGPNYRPASVFTNVDLRMPERVLLVDDEQDFVLTLSERLQMRHLEPAIAHDGQEALDILASDEPEVMILDLKMPGIDGIEVLRRVKAEHPEVQVIILTGHGSEKDRELCMELGAFAYLEKPVDIGVLSETMRQANDKIQARNKVPEPDPS